MPNTKCDHDTLAEVIAADLVATNQCSVGSPDVIYFLAVDGNNPGRRLSGHGGHDESLSSKGSVMRRIRDAFRTSCA